MQSLPSATFTEKATPQLLQQVRNDIATGKLTSLSFRTLQRQYQIGHSMAKLIRQTLLKEGIAYQDQTTHQITLIIQHK